MAIQKIASTEIKKVNRNIVYQLLMEFGSLSRQDIVQKAGLSLPTVTQNINSLIEQGLVGVSGSIGSTGGRNAQTYAIVKQAKAAIGLDVTRSHITAVLVDITGSVMHKIRIDEIFHADDAYFRVLGQLVERLIKETQIDAKTVLGVGIGVPALLSKDHCTMINGEKLGCTGMNCKKMAYYIPFPSIFFNDSDSACFSEVWDWNDLGDAFYLMLSDSVGGAYMFNGGQDRPCENFRHSEIGHATIFPEGKLCYCGKKGCGNAYCMASVLSQASENNLEQFFLQLRAGDPRMQELWQEYLSNLSYIVSNIRVTMQCKIIIGGYVGVYIDDYIDDLRKLTIQRNFFESSGEYIIPCKYKNESIAAGAALPYIDQFLKSI